MSIVVLIAIQILFSPPPVHAIDQRLILSQPLKANIPLNLFLHVVGIQSSSK